jgi:hypothetical protein
MGGGFALRCSLVQLSLVAAQLASRNYQTGFVCRVGGERNRPHETVCACIERK